MMPREQVVDQAKKARTANTARVFTTGQVVHLRFNTAGTERMVPIKCLGTQGPSSQIVGQWTEEAANQVGAPRLGTAVQVYLVVKGVLNIAKGEIVDVADGRLPRLRIQVEKARLAVPMRKHERQAVLGQVRLGSPGDPGAYRQSSPHEMDISLGGFGIGAPSRDWVAGQEVEFNLQVWAQDRKGAADANQPGLELNGAGIIRCVRPIVDTGNVWLGMQFEGLPETQVSSLSTWLSALVTFQQRS